MVVHDQDANGWQADDAIVSENLSGVITSWNKGAERRFGYTAEQAIGGQHIALIIPRNRLREEDEILSRIRRGERVDHFETARVRKDGTTIELLLTISPVLDLDAELRARTRELEQRNADILKQSEQLREFSRRLLRAQEEKRRHIAHELHDSAGQTLTVLGLSVNHLVQQVGQYGDDLASETAMIQELLQQLDREIRTASYLLHRCSMRTDWLQL